MTTSSAVPAARPLSVRNSSHRHDQRRGDGAEQKSHAAEMRVPAGARSAIETRHATAGRNRCPGTRQARAGASATTCAERQRPRQRLPRSGVHHGSPLPWSARPLRQRARCSLPLSGASSSAPSLRPYVRRAHAPRRSSGDSARDAARDPCRARPRVRKSGDARPATGRSSPAGRARAHRQSTQPAAASRRREIPRNPAHSSSPGAMHGERIAAGWRFPAAARACRAAPARPAATRTGAARSRRETARTGTPSTA